MMSEKGSSRRDNIARLPLSPKTLFRPQSINEIDVQSIQNRGYQVIRGFGVDVIEFEQVFNRISNQQLYCSPRVGGICHQYSVEINSENFSQQMRIGGFHTDFMFQDKPPEYVGLLCLETDPKHPIYGRNQIVSMSALLDRLSSGFGLSIEDILQRNLPYHFANGQHFSVPLLHRANGQLQFKFHQHLVADGMYGNKFKEKEIETYMAQLHAAMIDVAEDICLDAGDLLVLSNHHALHRRGECSVSFNTDNKTWRSRKMASIRFNL
tara:strand:- start:2324 stop:3121 length:798 start_codon:yes stop_codon:yes gene_type:complete